MLDTSAARRNILQRIRAAHRQGAEPAPAERAAVEDYLTRHPEGPRPRLPEDLVTHFQVQAEKMSSTVVRVAAAADVPVAAAHYLKAHALPHSAAIWNTLSGLDWAAAGIQVEARAPRDADLVGIGGVFCAVAETGTLVFLSGKDTPATTSLLPETHVAIVPATRIVAGIEDAFALMRSECGELPRATNFVSGPSRTGDIEQTIVLGAHGPYRVHIIIVDVP